MELAGQRWLICSGGHSTGSARKSDLGPEHRTGAYPAARRRYRLYREGSLGKPDRVFWETRWVIFADDWPRHMQDCQKFMWPERFDSEVGYIGADSFPHRYGTHLADLRADHILSSVRSSINMSAAAPLGGLAKSSRTTRIEIIGAVEVPTEILECECLQPHSRVTYQVAGSGVREPLDSCLPALGGVAQTASAGSLNSSLSPVDDGMSSVVYLANCTAH